MPATDRLRIDTPEQVTLDLPIAGIGSRFLAIAVDTLVQIVATVLIVLFAGAFVHVGDLAAGLGTSQSIVYALLVLFIFAMYWGYFSGFEILWKGQTPGKRAAGIRVIRESGAPIDTPAAILRNLFRAIDFLPAMYAAGVLCMVLNRHSRRLGDFVAGTVVIHDRTANPVPDWSVADGPPVSSEEGARVTADEVVLIETYLERRFTLAPAVQDKIARQIAERIVQRTGRRPARDQNLDDFLKTVARQARDAGRYR